VRLFFALWPDPEWSQQLLDSARAAIAEAGGRSVAGADLHVTLCFLGAVAEPVLARLRERVAGLQAAEFALQFDALEYWPRSRVLVTTSSHLPAAAGELACALRSGARALGLSPGELPSRPHVTLARGAAIRPEAAGPALSLCPPLQLAARRFYLAQSHELEPTTATAAQTPRYQRLASWPLE
jgi:RNA 2',3'-cyclic 3'-phosphodiesterase